MFGMDVPVTMSALRLDTIVLSIWRISAPSTMKLSLRPGEHAGTQHLDDGAIGKIDDFEPPILHPLRRHEPPCRREARF